MRFRILCLTAAAMLATGCATVDVTEIATPAAAKVEFPAEKNIVLRAASKLYAAFRSKGFVAETSREKMQSAASILLNGLDSALLRLKQIMRLKTIRATSLLKILASRRSMSAKLRMPPKFISNCRKDARNFGKN